MKISTTSYSSVITKEKTHYLTKEGAAFLRKTFPELTRKASCGNPYRGFSKTFFEHSTLGVEVPASMELVEIN